MTRYLLSVAALMVLVVSAACDTAVEPAAKDEPVPVGVASHDDEEPPVELDCTINLSSESGFLIEAPPGVQVVQELGGSYLSVGMDPGIMREQCSVWELRGESPVLSLDRVTPMGPYRILHSGSVYQYQEEFTIELWVFENGGAGEPRLVDTDAVTIWGRPGSLWDAIFTQLTVTCHDFEVLAGEIVVERVEGTSDAMPVRFEKVAGPTWLDVLDDESPPHGEVKASPGADLGDFEYGVRGTDRWGASATCYATVGVYQLPMTITAPTIVVAPGDTASGLAQHTNGTEPVTYRKVSGPDWISVWPDGTVRATPEESEMPGWYNYTIEGIDASTPSKTARATGIVMPAW